MTDEPNRDGPEPAAAWRRDWQTIWESELAALAGDREALEAVARAATTLASLHAAPASGPARTDAPPGAAAVAAAPGAGGVAGPAGHVAQDADEPARP